MVTALFALHSDRGDIKRTERGNYKLILKDLDQKHIWFTDRPDRLQGSLTSEEITEGWDSYFSDDSPNSVVSFQDKTAISSVLSLSNTNPTSMKKEQG